MFYKNNKKIKFAQAMALVIMALAPISTLIIPINKVNIVQATSTKSHIIDKNANQHTISINDNVDTKVSQPTKNTFKIHKYNETRYPTNTPNIPAFNVDLNSEYNLLGARWNYNTITYNTLQLPPKINMLVNEAIKQINQLNLVHLVSTESIADITFNTDEAPTATILGNTQYTTLGDYKGLGIITKANINLYPKNIKAGSNTNLLYNQVIIHELGHALGLAHTSSNYRNIMSPTIAIGGNILSNDNKHMVIDQLYINSLATLYKN